MTTRTGGRDSWLRRVRRSVIVLSVAMVAPMACDDATDVQVLVIEASGVVSGQAFLDLDGSGTASPGDEPLPGVDVVLITSGTAQVVDLATTDSLGAFSLFAVPVGQYRLSLDSAVLSDSLEVLDLGDPVSVALGDTSLVNLGVSYLSLTIEEVLRATPGSRVFTSGIALNPRVNFDPTGQVHFEGDSLFLRALNVERAPINAGDSVRILGRVVVDNGRTALDAVTPFPLIPQVSLVAPDDATTGTAASADGGLLDAALIRIRSAEITDTSTNVSGHFRFWADDGTDSVEVVLRDFLGFNTSVIRPDTIIRINQLIGLLTPSDDGSGAIRWQIFPRGNGDVVTETKFADVSVAMTLDTTQASLGDTVAVTVVASNFGPVQATLVQVRDTVPSRMAFVSATQTVGTYDDTTGLWDIGTVGPGVADTLVVRLEVVDGTPGFAVNIAESLGLTFEVDANPGNDGALVALTIS
jgi:uncharacterized repeat protein (TIGR01451 family)